MLLKSLRKGTIKVQLLQCQKHGQRCASHKPFPRYRRANLEETRARTRSHFSSPITVVLFSPTALNNLHISRSQQNYWAAPFRRLSPVSICSNGPNSGCVTGDFLWPRRVCAFNISSSKSYTGTTFLHFMLRRCSIPLLLWRRTENKSTIWVWQCREEKHANGFKRILFLIRS